MSGKQKINVSDQKLVRGVLDIPRGTRLTIALISPAGIPRAAEISQCVNFKNMSIWMFTLQGSDDFFIATSDHVVRTIVNGSGYLWISQTRRKMSCRSLTRANSTESHGGKCEDIGELHCEDLEMLRGRD